MYMYIVFFFFWFGLQLCKKDLISDSFDNQQRFTYISYEQTLDVVRRICEEQWMKGVNGDWVREFYTVINDA